MSLATATLSGAAAGLVAGIATWRLVGSAWQALALALTAAGFLASAAHSPAPAVAFVVAFVAGLPAVAYLLTPGRGSPGGPGAPAREARWRGLLEAYVAEVAGRQGAPPRRYDRPVVAGLAVRERAGVGLFLTAVGGVIVLIPVAEGWTLGEDFLGVAFLSALGATSILLVVLTRTLAARRAHQALEAGVPARAKVLDFARRDAYTDQLALEAGCWVEHPLGSFEAVYRAQGLVAERWGEALAVGADLEVLVDPERPRVLIWLGPDREPPVHPVPREEQVWSMGRDRPMRNRRLEPGPSASDRRTRG